jgi:hypothetical protein
MSVGISGFPQCSKCYVVALAVRTEFKDLKLDHLYDPRFIKELLGYD